ncbi:MAG: 50S ribosomal protein L18 [Gammaproteobacteria bacterium]|nr:50S ribosomal protein L18 [Gammaproteobacteria bacterium]
MIKSKKQSRIRRTRKTRAKIKTLGQVRLSVHRSANHIYAQVIAPSGDKVLAQASSLEAAIKEKKLYGGNKTTAAEVGKLIAERAIKAGIKQVAFDRSGFRFHGRVKALADAAREGGIEF